jgi:hypothetical protein
LCELVSWEMKPWALALALALAHLSHRSVGYHEDGPGGATLFALTAARAALLNDFGCHGQTIDVDTFGLANLHADEATATDICIYFRDAFSVIIFRNLTYHTNPIPC